MRLLTNRSRSLSTTAPSLGQSGNWPSSSGTSSIPGFDRDRHSTYSRVTRDASGYLGEHNGKGFRAPRNKMGATNDKNASGNLAMTPFGSATRTAPESGT